VFQFFKNKLKNKGKATGRTTVVLPLFKNIKEHFVNRKKNKRIQ